MPEKFRLEKFLDEFFAERRAATLEQLAKCLRTDLTAMRECAGGIVAEWMAAEETYPDFRTAAARLVSWMRVRITQPLKPKQDAGTKESAGDGRERRAEEFARYVGSKLAAGPPDDSWLDKI